MVNICSTIGNDVLHTDEVRVTVDIKKNFYQEA